MCGILLEYATDEEKDVVLGGWRKVLRRRGPDRIGELHVKERNGRILLAASVLQLRGAAIADAESFPLRDEESGAVLLFNGEIYGGIAIEKGENDAMALLRAMVAATRADGEEALMSLLSRVRGPWSLVFYMPELHCLWYGRDVLGRRSLLVHRRKGRKSGFVLASLAVPLRSDDERGEMRGNGGEGQWNEVQPGFYRFELGERESINEGPDDRATIAWKCPDLLGVREQRRRGRIPGDDDDEPPPLRPLPGEDVSVEEAAWTARVLNALDAAVATRVECFDFSLFASMGSHQGDSGVGTEAPFAVGFSGGIDSCILAVLLDRHLPPHYPIDLVNVSFDGEKAPDRTNARTALEELRCIAPTRDWHFIAIDVSSEEAEGSREHILNLLAPADTYMDLNIGTALWYAGRATAECRARVFFLGTGIDEQCAGYGRHFSRFRDEGWTGLQRELALDVERLWKRNLGRDDRLIADNGREARHPFLDEEFMRVLLEAPLEYVADLRLPKGSGDKLIIRRLAVALGLKEAAGRVKRAIQFGSRSAKLSNVREFGSNRAANAAGAGACKVGAR